MKGVTKRSGGATTAEKASRKSADGGQRTRAKARTTSKSSRPSETLQSSRKSVSSKADAFVVERAESTLTPELHNSSRELINKPSIGSITAELDAGARLETYNFALRTLEKHGEALTHVAQRLAADAPTDGASLPKETKDLIELIVRSIEAQDGEGPASEARRVLTDAMTVFRSGTMYYQGFSLSPVAVRELPQTPNVRAQPGFSPSVDIAKLSAKTSLQDPQSYVDDRLGRFVVEDLIRNRRPLEFHVTSDLESLSLLKSRGFDSFYRVMTPKSEVFNQLLLVHNSRTGDTRYVINNFSGQDRLEHLQKLAATAVVDGERISSSQVQVWSNRALAPQEIYRNYSRALLKLGTVPDTVVIGFKNGILSELGSRSVGARKLEYVQSLLGKKAAAGLRARASGSEAGKALLPILDRLGSALDVLEKDSAYVFRFAREQDSLRVVEKALVTALLENPSLEPILGDLVSERGFKIEVNGHVRTDTPVDTFIDQAVISYKDASGASRSMLLTRSPYGDLAHEMGKVLVDNDVKNVFVLGTAGGLQPGDQVGDIHVPGSVVDARGRKTPLDNSALAIVESGFLDGAANVKKGTTTVEVNSPLDETQDLIDSFRTKQYDSVEMELADLVKGLQNSKTKLSSVYIVSDVPGTAHTLESHSGDQMKDSLRKLTDLLIEQMGVRDVTLKSDAQRPVVGAWIGANQLAERVMKARGASGAQFELLKNNLARYLMNGLSDKAIQSLLADEKADPLVSPQLMSRWKEKAEREIKVPYDNAKVVAHLTQLGRTLGEMVQEIEKNGGKPGTYKLHILGSIVKGRAGVGSDVDVLLETDDKALEEKMFKSRFGFMGAPKDSLVVLGGYAYATSRGKHYGPIVDIGDGRKLLQSDQLLVELFAQSLAPLGLTLHVQPNGDVLVDSQRLLSGKVDAPVRETESISEKILEYEKTYRGFIDTDFLLKHLKDVTPLADVSHLPFQRLVERGKALVEGELRQSLTREALVDYLESPAGATKLASERGAAFLKKTQAKSAGELALWVKANGIASLPLEGLVDGEMAADILKLGEPLDRLAVDFYAAEQAKAIHEKTAKQPGKKGEMLPVDVALLATEVLAAKDAEVPFFERHVAKGTGQMTVGKAVITYGTDGTGRVDIASLAKNDPVASMLLETAREFGVHIGFWGGSARDLLLGRKRDISSDLDLVYDSREANFSAFKKAAFERVKAQFGEAAPELDFSVDQNPAKPMRGPYRGLTIEKVALMSDGRVFDFTAKGLSDFKAGILRYNATNAADRPGVGMAFRMVGAKIQNPSMQFAPETDAELRSVLSNYYGPNSPSTVAIRAFGQKADGKSVKELHAMAKDADAVARATQTPSGGAWVDVMKVAGKMVKGGLANNPRVTLGALQEYGLDTFLSSIDQAAVLAPLQQAANLPPVSN